MAQRLKLLNIPKYGSDQLSGHYFSILNILKILKYGNGAGTRNRTADLLITNQSLYQLSYPGLSRSEQGV